MHEIHQPQQHPLVLDALEDAYRANESFNRLSRITTTLGRVSQNEVVGLPQGASLENLKTLQRREEVLFDSYCDRAGATLGPDGRSDVLNSQVELPYFDYGNLERPLSEVYGFGTWANFPNSSISNYLNYITGKFRDQTTVSHIKVDELASRVSEWVGGKRPTGVGDKTISFWVDYLNHAYFPEGEQLQFEIEPKTGVVLGEPDPSKITPDVLLDTMNVNGEPVGLVTLDVVRDYARAVGIETNCPFRLTFDAIAKRNSARATTSSKLPSIAGLGVFFLGQYHTGVREVKEWAFDPETFTASIDYYNNNPDDRPSRYSKTCAAVLTAYADSLKKIQPQLDEETKSAE